MGRSSLISTRNTTSLTSQPCSCGFLPDRGGCGDLARSPAHVQGFGSASPLRKGLASKPRRRRTKTLTSSGFPFQGQLALWQQIGCILALGLELPSANLGYELAR